MILDYYKCTACQRYHYQADPLYHPHMSHQSKEGMQNGEVPRVSAKQYNELNPETFVLTDGTRYIAEEQPLIGCTVILSKDRARVWSSMDATPMRLAYFSKISGLNLWYRQVAVSEPNTKNATES